MAASGENFIKTNVIMVNVYFRITSSKNDYKHKFFSMFLLTSKPAFAALVNVQPNLLHMNVRFKMTCTESLLTNGLVLRGKPC